MDMFVVVMPLLGVLLAQARHDGCCHPLPEVTSPPSVHRHVNNTRVPQLLDWWYFCLRFREEARIERHARERLQDAPGGNEWTLEGSFEDMSAIIVIRREGLRAMCAIETGLSFHSINSSTARCLCFPRVWICKRSIEAKLEKD